jgi:hypothetical protein
MGIERQAHESSQKTQQNQSNPRKKRKTQDKTIKKNPRNKNPGPYCTSGGKEKAFLDPKKPCLH